MYEDKPVLDRRAYRSLLPTENPKPQGSFLNEVNHTCNFSDLVCCFGLAIVAILGVAGILLGFGLPMYFPEDLKTLSNTMVFILTILFPLSSMLFCMTIGFVIWAKFIDCTREWELGVSDQRGPGLASACQEFFSLSNPCLKFFKRRTDSLSASSRQVLSRFEAKDTQLSLDPDDSDEIKSVGI